MQQKLINTLLILGLTGITYFNGIYNPKSLLIGAIIALGLLVYNYKQLQSSIILTLINLYLISSLYISNYTNLGYREVLLLITCFTLINFKEFFKKNLKIISQLVAFLAIIQLILSLQQVFLNNFERSFGFFQDLYNHNNFFPNSFALFNLLGLGFYRNFKDKTQNILILTSFLNIYLSQSRGGLIAFFIFYIGQLVHKFITRENNHLFIKKNLLSISVILIIIMGFNLLNKQELNLKFEGTSKLTSVNERIETFGYALQEILKNPLQLNGADSYQEFSRAYQTRWLANAPHPHNFLVKYWSELGIGFVIIFLAFAFEIIKNLKFNPSNSRFIESLIIIIVIFHNSIDYNLNFTINAFLFFILLSQNYSNKTLKINLRKINLSILTIMLGIFMYNYQSLRIIRNNLDIPGIYQNLNFEDSILLQLQKANSLQEIIPESNLNYYAAKSYNLNLNNFELAKYYQNKNLQKSELYIQAAIQQNPRNNWDFYKFLLENNFQSPQSIEKELQNYLELAKENIHFTSNSSNIYTAFEVCNLARLNFCQEFLQTAEKFKK